MRYPKKSLQADALKTKQSHHKGRKRKLKDADMEVTNGSNNGVINEYRRQVSSKYKISQTVFDGYKSKTNWDHKYARREACNPPFADVLVDKNINVPHSREEFLRNSNS